MDEFERLEQELEKVYEQYLIKFRCLAYLEQQLEELEKAEREHLEVCFKFNVSFKLLIKAEREPRTCFNQLAITVIKPCF